MFSNITILQIHWCEFYNGNRNFLRCQQNEKWRIMFYSSCNSHLFSCSEFWHPVHSCHQILHCFIRFCQCTPMCTVFDVKSVNTIGQVQQKLNAGNVMTSNCDQQNAMNFPWSIWNEWEKFSWILHLVNFHRQTMLRKFFFYEECRTLLVGATLEFSGVRCELEKWEKKNLEIVQKQKKKEKRKSQKKKNA